MGVFPAADTIDFDGLGALGPYFINQAGSMQVAGSLTGYNIDFPCHFFLWICFEILSASSSASRPSLPDTRGLRPVRTQ